jgi:CheY-like chemotaxis protein
MSPPRNPLEDGPAVFTGHARVRGTPRHRFGASECAPQAAWPNNPCVAPPPSGARTAQDGATSAPLRVLVVDDEPMVRAVVANILEAAGGMEVATAADGFEAGKLVADLHPHAVVLDLRMPGLDGATVCRRIKNDPRTADIRVLFVTAYTDPDNLNLIRTAGADGYLSKPFAAQELVEAVLDVGAAVHPAHGCALLASYGRRTLRVPHTLVAFSNGCPTGRFSVWRTGGHSHLPR